MTYKVHNPGAPQRCGTQQHLFVFQSTEEICSDRDMSRIYSISKNLKHFGSECWRNFRGGGGVRIAQLHIYYLILRCMHMNLGLHFKCNPLRMKTIPQHALISNVNSNESIAKI